MTVPQLATEPRLSFEQPVPRALVHRHAISEVYVTDSAELAENSYALAAVLPRRHWFYTDGPGGPASVAALLEVCRQAGTVVAHRYFDVPPATAFLVGGYELTMLGAAAGTDLLLRVTTSGARHRQGTLSALHLRIEVECDGVPVAVADIAATYLAAGLYADMRRMRRGSEPPSSADRPAHRAGITASPSKVARSRHENVLLVDAVRSDERLVAVLDVPVDHASLYDHPLDHVPAMALLEAAQQAATHLAGGDVLALRAGFRKIVELDAPAQVVATTGPDAVSVEIVQGGQLCCDVRLVLR